MNTTTASIIEQSMQLELNVAELYKIFHNTFAEHNDFWWTLHLEEKNHAALIRAAKEIFEPKGKLPHSLFLNDLQQLEACNIEIKTIIDNYQNNPPALDEAFNVALKLEQSAAELHYQDFMEQEDDSALTKTFRRLNQDDKDHAERLCAYMNQHGIPINLGGV